MDIGGASSLSLYTYQTTAQSSGRQAAALQALAQTYTNAADSGAGLFQSDPLASLAGTDQAIASLTSGIYSASSGSFSTEGLSSATVGGLDASSAAGLLGSLTGSGLESLSSVQPSTAAALAAYQLQQNAAGSDLASLVQSAQATQFGTTLNLLG